MTLLFSKKDVEAAGHPLVRIMRLICYRKKITIDRFSTLYAEHGVRLGRQKDINDNYRNNARKALNPEHDDMTWRFFHYIMVNVLRVDIVELKIVVRSDSGELTTIGSNDPVEPEKIGRASCRERV